MITKVTENVSIGDSEDSRNATTDQCDVALNVAIDLDIAFPVEDGQLRYTGIRRHKVGLYDGPGNEPLTFVSAVLLLYALVKSGRRVLLHCRAGASRSVMVGATYVALTEDITLDKALERIMPLRKVDIYRLDLYTLAHSSIPIIKEIVTKTYGKTL